MPTPKKKRPERSSLAVLPSVRSQAGQDCYRERMRVEVHPEGGLRLITRMWLPVTVERQKLYSRFPPETRGQLMILAQQQENPIRADIALRLLIYIQTRSWEKALDGSGRTAPALNYIARQVLKKGPDYLTRRFG